MKVCTDFSNEHSSLQVCVPEGYDSEVAARAREVIGLYTDPGHRNKGHAKALMEQVIQEAETAGFALLLHCKPEDGQTDSKRLQSFYASLGFVVFQHSPLLMCRPPNGRRH